MSINRVAISGNLGGDSELRSTSGGTSVLSFSVAVTDRTKDAGGNWTDRTNWVGCVLFGARAEKLAAHLVKGTKVAIEGKLRYSSWERDGQRRSKLDVVVDEIEFMSRREQPQPAYQQQPQQAARAAQPQPALYDDDIPF